nr:MAG TPA: hypothetical protein [Caudoviricetes sp.]
MLQSVLHQLFYLFCTSFVHHFSLFELKSITFCCYQVMLFKFIERIFNFGCELSITQKSHSRGFILQSGF